MDREIMDTLQLIVENMATKDDIRKLDERLSAVEDGLQKVQISLEHDVSKKIEALFDGYKLTHEKQWELERRVDGLERRLEELETQSA